MSSSTTMKAKSASGYEGAGPIGLVALIRQGLDEFLAFPFMLVGVFTALAAFTLWMDNTDIGPIRAGREMLGRFVFVTESGTASVLGQLLGGLLTVISITFSALLLAVQQTATTLSNQVYSQFLRRRVNQLYFGFFLGLAVYDIAALAAAHPHFNPVWSASLAVLMTTAGLCLLIVVIYSTVDQMRPSVIVESLRDHTLAARERALDVLDRTRRISASRAPVVATVRADDDGFLQKVDLDRLARLLRSLGPDAEIEILHAVGAFVAYDDPLALIRTGDPSAAREIGDEVRSALVRRGERDLTRDAAFGIVQLESIAWTTASSAKSTPDAPRMVIYALRDLLGRWIATELSRPPRRDVVPVVLPDRTHRDALDALVTIGLASDESRQHVVIATAFDALAHLLPRTSRDLREHVVDGVRTLIPALSDLPLGARLHEALSHARHALGAAGLEEVARELSVAAAAMEERKGRLRTA
jgi:hypothetical protein